MGGDNRDRYGYRHRRDSAYEPGESMPGEVGDSSGTFHDRATSDNRVIVDGKVQSYEKHQREQNKESPSTTNTQQSRQSKRSESFSGLDGGTVEVSVDRVSGSGNAIAEYQGYQVHVEGGEPGKTYQVELTSQSGYFEGKVKLNE